jgi:nucleotide-binding universal stress UspA family protein
VKITKVLFPTDFSEGAVYAFPYAIDMVKTYKAELHLVHILYDFVVATGLHVPHTSVDTLYLELEQSAAKQLENFGLDQRKDIPGIQTAILRGVPYEELLKYAETHGIDLIVIGTHGRKGLDRMLFGSTAERVVRNATCPVLTVRRPGV